MRLLYLKERIQNQPIFLLLIGVIFIFSVLSDHFFSIQNFSNVLVQSSALIIVATGMTFVLLTAGIDLSVGAIMFVTGVLVGKLIVGGHSIVITIPLALFAGIVFGLINGLSIARLKIIPFIVTLATLYIGRGLGLYLSDTRAINLPEEVLQLGSGRLLGIPFPVIIMIGIVLFAHSILTSTSFGRQLYAIGHSSEKARKAGIPVELRLIFVYMICGICAALGGLIAIAQLGAVSPSFGFQYEFMAIAAAVLGGASLFGGRGQILPNTVFGALIIQMIQSGLVHIQADPYLHPVITGTIIFLIVMVDSRLHFSRKISVARKFKP